MKDKDTIILEETYTKIREAIFPPYKSTDIGRTPQNVSLKDLRRQAFDKQNLGVSITPTLDNIDYQSIEIDGIDDGDYPDFVDAYISYATYKDGAELSHEELNKLNDGEGISGFINEYIHDNQLWHSGRDYEFNSER